MKKSILFAAALLLAAAVTGAFAAEGQKFEQFWTQYTTDFQDEVKYKEALAFLDLCKEAGLTHLTLGEQSMQRWDLVDDAYRAKIAEFQKAAKDRGITIVPSLFPIGYGVRYLVHDVNLAAGLPVKDAPFIVKDGAARPDPSEAPAIANPGFEDGEGNQAAGWTQDAPGERTLVDTAEKHSGKASLKLSAGPASLTPPAPPAPGERRRREQRNARATQTLTVSPFRYYRLSLWIKTQDAGKPGEDMVLLFTHDRQRRNAYRTLEIQPTQDWTRHDVVFNTLDADKVELSVGASMRSGAIWIDDIAIEPAGILNVVRRDMTPLTITSADGKTAYEEGRDFEHVSDPLFIYKNLADIEHEPAAIQLTAGSRIKDGETVLVSYYHTQRIYVDQVVLSLSDPELYELMDKQMAHVAKLWPSPLYFMSADEIRIAGWELQPNGENLTPSQLLARYMERSFALVKKYMPESNIIVWTDMFTPFHNARPFEDGGYYYLTTGTFYGSWSGLPRDVVVGNWYIPEQAQPGLVRGARQQAGTLRLLRHERSQGQHRPVDEGHGEHRRHHRPHVHAVVYRAREDEGVLRARAHVRPVGSGAGSERPSRRHRRKREIAPEAHRYRLTSR